MSITGRLLLAAWVVVVALLGSSALASMAALRADDALVELCAHAGVVELWLAGAACAAALLVARPARDVLGLGPGRLSWPQIGLLALGTLALSHALDGALDLSGLSEHSALAALEHTLEGARGTRLWIALLALGVAPGIAEELLCRGLVQRGLARRIGPALAIPAAALVFGALHVEPIHAVFASLLGLYLGLVAHWGGSTRPAMLCHGANNLAAVLLAAQLGDVPWPPGASLAGGALLAGACLAAVGRSVRSRSALQPEARPSDR